MLIFAIVLISITGVLCEENCWYTAHKECIQENRPTAVPETSEELETICRSLTAHVKCNLDVFKECGKEREIAFMQHALNFLEERDICDQKNPTFKAIAENLKCVETAAKTAYAEECNPDKIGEERETVIQSYNASKHEQGPLSDEDLACLWSIWDISCICMAVGDHCGSEVRDAVFDVYSNLDYHLQTYCSEDVIEEIPVLLEALALAGNQGGILENIVRRRK